jgi:hypothetical protein
MTLGKARVIKNYAHSWSSNSATRVHDLREGKHNKSPRTLLIKQLHYATRSQQALDDSLHAKPKTNESRSLRNSLSILPKHASFNTPHRWETRLLATAISLQGRPSLRPGLHAEPKSFLYPYLSTKCTNTTVRHFFRLSYSREGFAKSAHSYLFSYSCLLILPAEPALLLFTMYREQRHKGTFCKGTGCKMQEEREALQQARRLIYV